MKRLIVLQYWDGDRAQALETAKLIADLEPVKNDSVEFMMACRFDSSQDKRTLEHVARKFNVHSFVSRRRETGWPAGCNALWFDSMTRVYELVKAKRMPGYKAILTIEADVCPLRPGWLEILDAEWDRAKVRVMGDLLQAPGTHINGNAWFSGDMTFLNTLANKIIGCSPTGGWDYLLAPLFKKAGWYGTPTMRSEWGRNSEATEAEYGAMLKRGLVLHHGLKNDSLQRLVRARWVPSARMGAPLIPVAT